jgi:hypothetical protein
LQKELERTLANLVLVFVEGREQLQTACYGRPEVMQALNLLAKIKGKESGRVIDPLDFLENGVGYDALVRWESATGTVKVVRSGTVTLRDNTIRHITRKQQVNQTTFAIKTPSGEQSYSSLDDLLQKGLGLTKRIS